MKPKGTVCLSCQREVTRQRSRRNYAKNREREQRKQRARYRKNKQRYSERSHAYYITHRKEILARVRKWEETHQEQRKEYLHDWYRRMREDPERYARYLEDKRLASRLRAERKGRPKRPLSEAEYTERYGDGNHSHIGALPAEPLRTVIGEWVQQEGSIKKGTEQLSAMAGVSDRRIRSILKGEQDRVSLRSADRLCAVLNVPLTSLYFEGPR